MNIIAKDFNRPLARDEQESVSRSFTTSNPSAMRYLGAGGEMIETQEPNPEQCDTFYCFSKGTLIKAYYAENGSFVGNVGPAFKHEICTLPQYKCVEFNRFYATYNCIGWALGISQWINPSIITNNIKHHGMSKRKAIDKFLRKIDDLYPIDHQSNFEELVGKLDTKIGKTHPVANNSINFYFKEDECLHGSRYLETVNTQPLNQWTSKLGQELLLSHSELDLIGDSSPYGTTLHFVGVDQSSDEL